MQGENNYYKLSYDLYTFVHAPPHTHTNIMKEKWKTHFNLQTQIRTF